MRAIEDLRRELSARNQHIAVATGRLHELTTGNIPSVIFGRDQNGHGNFHPTSYRNINANPEWARRLAKIHTARRRASPEGWRWRELDCANSSDALLMNIFCYRRVLCADLSRLLGISCRLEPHFGVRAHVPLLNGRTDRTEVDMKIGDLLVEAKLTEVDFQSAPLRLIERYRDLKETFDDPELLRTEHIIRSYQLIRGVLAARAAGSSFCVLCDARRPDLIESWYSVIRVVRDCDLRCRLKLLTWQEVAEILPPSLRSFVATKYGISP